MDSVSLLKWLEAVIPPIVILLILWAESGLRRSVSNPSTPIKISTPMRAASWSSSVLSTRWPLAMGGA